jgi:hypothetical protein
MTDPTARKILEHLTDAWSDAIQSDLENGVRCLNEAAATEFHQKYPSISRFGEFLHDLYMELHND